MIDDNSKWLGMISCLFSFSFSQVTFPMSSNSEFSFYELWFNRVVNVFTIQRIVFFIARMTGHQQLVNDVKFSPDSRMIASASFDKSIKLWDGRTGVFITTLRGHVQRVHQIAWSADSRLLVSGSADSTLKGWVFNWIVRQSLYILLPVI